MPNNPIAFANATLVPADSAATNSVSTAQINGAAPGVATSNPVDPMAPPSLAANGPTFITTKTGSNQVVISTNAVPKGASTTTLFTTGQPAAKFIMDPAGTFEIRTITTVPGSGDVADTTFTNYSILNISGDIFSPGPITRHWATGVYVHTGGSKLDNLVIWVPFGKIFESPAPSSVTATLTSGSGVSSTIIATAKQDGCKLLITSSDLVAGTETMFAEGFVTASQ